MGIIYKKGSLFEAPKGSMLVHAVNCAGVWGAGIAAEFAKRFPEANKAYSHYSRTSNFNPLGTAFVVADKGYIIGNLFTSDGYGYKVDSKDKILYNTEQALKDQFLIMSDFNMPREVHSNKFNSGLFRVPWEETEAVLTRVLPSDVTWIVHSLE